MRIYINEKTGYITLEDSEMGTMDARSLLRKTNSSVTFMVKDKDIGLAPVSLSSYMTGKINRKAKGVSSTIAVDGATSALAKAFASVNSAEGGSKEENKEKDKNPEQFRIRAEGFGVQDEHGTRRPLMLFFGDDGIKWNRQFLPEPSDEQLSAMAISCCIAEYTHKRTRHVTFGDGYNFPVENLFRWDHGAMKFTKGTRILVVSNSMLHA